MRKSFSSVLSGALTAVVLFAVPALAIYFADLSVFSESVRLADVRAAVAHGADDAVLLANWQFTDSQSEDNKGGNGNGNGKDKNTVPSKKTKPTTPVSKHTGK